MNYGQVPRGTLPHLNSRRVAEDDAVLATYPTYTRPVYEQSVQGQTPNQPSTNYPPDCSPPGTMRDLRTYTPGVEENRGGFTLSYPTPLTTHPYSRYPAVGAHHQGNVSSSFPGPRNSVAQTPHNGVVPSEGTSCVMTPPERVGGYSYNHTPGHRRRSLHGRPTLEGQESDYTLYGNRDESAISRCLPLLIDGRLSSSGAGRHEYQPPVMNERSMSSHLSHLNHPGPHSYPTMDRTTCQPENTFTPGRPRGDGWRGPHDAHPEAHFFHWQHQPVSIPKSTGPSGASNDAPEHAEPSGRRSPSDWGSGGVGHLAELPPGPRSDRPHGRPTGVQRPKKGRQTKRIADSGKAVLTQKPTRKGIPGGSKDSMAQLRATSVVTRGPTRFVTVPQTQYKCPTKQDDWEETSIEFGSIKLTDAANGTYPGHDGHDDKVLKYSGAGSSILCRVNFSEDKIETLKIRTTNNKTPPEAITKKKLAFEVAKLVKRHVESIKAIPGCDNVAFESLVLARLVRVSRASWQPELLREVPSSGFGSS